MFTNFGKVSICLLNRLVRFSIARKHMLQGTFEYVWGNFSFSQSNKIKLLNFRVMKNRVMNDDFPDSLLYRLEQAFGKTACKRN